jgi:glycosyltransferase involved in cell wall biosynthesis
MQNSNIYVSVVVPIHNESQSVATLIERICSAFQSPTLESKTCELILVDDGSTDNTFQRAQEAAAQFFHSIRIISFRRNHGQTAAMQAGFEAATGEILVSLDGDLQNDPADIPRMVEYFEKHDLDLLCGRRRNRQDPFLSRKLPSWIANKIIGFFTGISISDYGCSLKAYRASILHQVELIGEMHRFVPAWISKITSPNRIGEIDVNHFPRTHGKTHYGISRTVRVMLDLMSVIFYTRIRNRPGHFFGTIGLAMIACGFMMLAIVSVDKFVGGQDVGSRPLLIIGALAFFSGIQMVSTGIVAELLSRIYIQTPKASQPSVLREYCNQVDDPSQVLPLKRVA